MRLGEPTGLRIALLGDRVYADDMTLDTQASPTVVEVFVDPGCPWAFQTSRWLREVQQVRPIELRWGLLSLAVLNEHNDIPEEFRPMMERGWRASRVLVATRRDHGDEAFEKVYQGIASRYHLDGRREETDEVIAEALADAGLPAELLQAGYDESLDGAVREAHGRAMAAYGEDMGTPLIAVDGAGYLGPVISRLPLGEDAGALWDAFRTITTIPGFYEIKSRRTEVPQFG